MDPQAADVASRERSLSDPDLIALCRHVLARASELRFRADGVSMRPALQPGDVLCVAPVSDQPPRVGQVVLTATPSGKALAHRLIACRRSRGGAYCITCGDAPENGLDAAVPIENVIGLVVAVERGGVRQTLSPRRPPLLLALQARWRLAVRDAGDERPLMMRVVAALLRLARALRRPSSP